MGIHYPELRIPWIAYMVLTLLTLSIKHILMQGVALKPRPCNVAFLDIFEYSFLLQGAECVLVLLHPQW